MSETMERHDADVETAEEIRRHHAVMVADLDRLSAALAGAADAGTDTGPERAALQEWIGTVLVPHAAHEEETTYPAAARLAEGRLLIAAMLAEHELIRHFAGMVAGSENPAAAGAYARALFETFASHQRKENDHILPLLVDDPSVSLTELLAGSHDHHH
ncbi:hemerythrin HHE cation binding domain-containing protein [Georgenia soli]|uniref:Hemerythrin HHE cation binding domain-containing protein n=1 Tax=Georgenia soli TaxID=638953 RepID=A0A2A9ELM6_9MICO|nr:hemerythrin domain-containing protein [Georgenia soli]PFG39506.1 hemerythrin HHE cation binding domain-containing protein [Georgenia soli]